jgi:hypothetical protein
MAEQKIGATTERVRRIPLALMLVMGMTLCAVLLLVAVPNRASADTEEGHSGYVGPHRLYEPGAACSSASKQLVVSAPGVWARSAYTNGQTVAYQAQLVRQDHAGGGYYHVANGPRIFRTAYPNYRANFPSTVFYLQNGYAQNYKVRVFMFWYYPSGAQMGYSAHMVDYYISNGSTGPYYCRA